MSTKAGAGPNVDSAIESDGGTFESDIPSSANEFCEDSIYKKRDGLIELRRNDPQAAAFAAALLEAGRNLVFSSVDIDETGIFATVSSDPASFRELGVDFRGLITESKIEDVDPDELRMLQKVRWRTEYVLVKEDGGWLVEEGKTVSSVPGEEQEETVFFPFE